MPPSSPLSVRKPISLRSLWLSYSRNPTLTLSFFIVGIVGTIFGTVSVFHSILGEKCKGFEPRSVKVTFESSSSSFGGVALLASPEAPRIGEMERQKVMGFVGIQTGFGSVGRRRSLRKTWMPANREGLKRLEEATGLAFRFVIGRTGDSHKMKELRKEIEEYDDFMLLDIEEEYNNLPRKTLAFFKAAYRLYDADFYVKADDDIYLRPDRLSSLLAKERSHPLTYLGCMKKGPVFTDPKLKWYEPLSYLLGSEYFLHAYGPIYALSAEVVNGLVAIKTDSFRLFSNEDVTIGVWMLAMNVNHETDWSLCQPACTQSSVAVWDIPKCSGLCHPEVQLLNLHKMESCSGIISQ